METLIVLPDRNDRDSPVDVFLSYARADSVPVGRLESVLLAEDLIVWRDVTDIEAFDLISDTLTSAIARCRVFIVWYSKTYFSRPACQWELIAALSAIAGRPRELARVLVLNPEPDFDHIHPVQLRDTQAIQVEGGDESSLSAAARKIAAHTRSFGGGMGVQASVAPRVFGRGGLVSESAFFGRAPDLVRLHSALWADSSPVISGVSRAGIVQIVGLAGSGKSMLAEEYAARFAQAYPGGIYWFRGGSSAELINNREQQFAALARWLLGDAWNVAGTANALSQIAGHLGGATLPYLWIVDDLPANVAADELRAWCAPTIQGRTILIGRAGESRGIWDTIELRGLSLEAARELLRSGLVPASVEEEAAAAELWRLLEGHPLALALAARSVESRGNRTAYRSFVAEINANVVSALDAAQALSGALPKGYERNIVATLLLTIEAMPDSARELLPVLTSFAQSQVPRRTLNRMVAEALERDYSTAVRLVDAGLAALGRASIVRRNNRSHIEVHALCSTVFRIALMRKEDVQAQVSKLSQVLARELSAARDSTMADELDQIAVHAAELLVRSKAQESLLAAYLARFYVIRGASKPAQNLLQKAYQLMRSGDLPQDREWIEQLYAEQLIQSGDVAEAEPLCALLLLRARQHWGQNHPSYASACVTYHRVLLASEELDQAEQWAKECRERWQADWNLRPKVASMRALLGATYIARGRAADAWLEARNALQTLAEFAFEGHPDRLRAILCMARAELQMGRLDPEPPVFRGAGVIAADLLKEIAGTWGLVHPYASEAASLISDVYRAQEGAEDADAFLWAFRELANGSQQGRGEAECRPSEEKIRSNREFLKTLLSLPSMEEIEENITQATQREFGPETFLQRLGRAPRLRSSARAALEGGDVDLALEIILELTRHYFRNPGPECPEYIGALDAMADVLSARSDHRWARVVRERIFEHWLEREGEYHPTTIQSALDLVILMWNAGDTRSAKLDFDRHVLVPLRDASATLTESLEKELPLIRQVEAAFAQLEETT